MLVLAAVPEVQLQRLRRAAGVRFTFTRAATWSEVLAAIRARPVELAVIDPTLGGEPRAQELERLRLLFPSLPLILYTALTPQLAAVLLALGQRGIRHVIFVRYDDHPERLREVLEREASGAASRRLLDQLADRLSPLPTELRWVLEEALRTPEEVQTVGRLPGFTIEDVAARLGYAQVKTLQQHARSYLGLTAGEMRLSLSTDEALDLVVRRFRQPASQAAAAVS